MIQSKRGLVFAFFLSLALSILFPFYVPKLSINFLIVPLVMLMYRASYSLTLTLAFLCGLYLDCLWLSVRLGFIAVSFLLAMRLLYPCRLYFFSDTVSTLVFMTYLFSSLTSFIQSILALFFEQASPLTNARWFLSDVCIMPLLDALYGWTAFALLPAAVRTLVQLVKKRRAKNASFG